MKNNFTPGPWEIVNGGDIFGPSGGDSGDGLAADSNDGWQVAEVGCYVTSVDGELTELGGDVRRANMDLIATAGTAASKLADMDIDAVKCIEMLPEIVPLIKDAMRSIDYEHGPGASDVNFPELTNFLDAIKAGGEE